MLRTLTVLSLCIGVGSSVSAAELVTPIEVRNDTSLARHGEVISLGRVRAA